MTTSHRSSHYFLWFLIFGAIPLVQTIVNKGFGANSSTYESLWLVGAGLLGLLVGNINEGKLAKPYDLLVGAIFSLAGLVGILGFFHVGTGSLPTTIGNVGLSLAALYPLVYTFLGLKSLHHGLERKK